MHNSAAAKLADFSKNANLNRLVKIILPSILGLLCIFYILTSFRWLEIWQILQQTDILVFFLSSTIATVVFWLLRAVRWAYLLRRENLDISFFKLYLYTAITVGLANFTPFQSGEALKVELFRKYGGQRLSGYTFFLFEKLLDFFCLSLLSLIGIFTLFDFNLGKHLQLIIIGFVMLLALLITIFVIISGQEKIKLIKRITLPDRKTLVITFLLTFASWIVLILGWKFILQSIHVELSIIQTASVISLTSIIGILSLVPGAIGVSEISIAAFLSHLGYENSLAQAAAVIMGIYSFVILLFAVIHLVILKSLNFINNRNFAQSAKSI